MIVAFDALIMYKPMVALQTEHYRLKARAFMFLACLRIVSRKAILFDCRSINSTRERYR